jgi:hypothetical protein
MVGLPGCALINIVFPSETRAPQEFPQSDIVFIGNGNVGFVDADGSNAAFVPLTIIANGISSNNYWRPVMTGDNQTLIVKAVYSHFFIYQPHPLALWRTGDLPEHCTQWGNQQAPILSSEQENIFIQVAEGLAVYPVESCGTDQGPVSTFTNIGGVPSPDLQYVAYTDMPSWIQTDDRFIVVRNLFDGKERTIGVGDYPAWSRDSHWLAYTGKDGFYVINIAEGSEPRRVSLYLNPFDKNDPTYSGGDYNEVPPEVSWSPDGHWLAYHKWTGTDPYTGIYPRYNTIYKLNIETGEETMIIEGGMYPSWRWPEENP